jgi:hypothetical protein
MKTTQRSCRETKELPRVIPGRPCPCPHQTAENVGCLGANVKRQTEFAIFLLDEELYVRWCEFHKSIRVLLAVHCLHAVHLFTKPRTVELSRLLFGGTARRPRHDHRSGIFETSDHSKPSVRQLRDNPCDYSTKMVYEKSCYCFHNRVWA